jgi:signal transduction histidine kinase
VNLKRVGEPDVLPAEVELAAYRIVQEGLTNVTRHANATTVNVRLEHRPDELLIRIEDDGRGSSGEPGNGHGITGMRERVAALGGRLHAGPVPGGGFHVEGRIPLSEQL